MYPLARQALTIYFNFAKGKLPFANVNDFIEHYRTHYYSDGTYLKHDDFLDSFDSALRVPTNKNDMTKAMQKLAEKTPAGKIPKNEAYFNALVDQVSNFGFTEIAKSVAQGAKEFAQTATIGIGAGVAIYLLVALGGLFIASRIK